MAGRLRRSDIEKRTAWALNKIAQQRGSEKGPLDLIALCAELGVEVEWRRMVPEGTFFEEDGLLKIALQSNFADDPVRRKRLRFTHAHEICHALLHRIPGCPAGAALEDLCQYGAGILLVPQEELEEIHGVQNRLNNLDDVRALAARFDVSLDVIVNRLHHNMVLGEDYAVAVARRSGDKEWISAVAHGDWLPENLRVAPGGDYTQWKGEIVRVARQVAENQWRLGIASGDVMFSLAEQGIHRTVAELRRQ